MSEETLAARLRRLGDELEPDGVRMPIVRERELQRALVEAAHELEPPPPSRPSSWPARVSVGVLAVSVVWLVMFFVVAGVAFFVSSLGGDIPGLLIGVPIVAAIGSGAVLLLCAVTADIRRRKQ